ncbi:MAG: hypothetical protein E5W04_04225 [Mesorhizobium sp.]|nr:MAG: hypothetical protein E5W04_04225 [Mesorhizobium sp.]
MIFPEFREGKAMGEGTVEIGCHRIRVLPQIGKHLRARTRCTGKPDATERNNDWPELPNDQN